MSRGEAKPGFPDCAAPPVREKFGWEIVLGLVALESAEVENWVWMGVVAVAVAGEPSRPRALWAAAAAAATFESSLADEPMRRGGGRGGASGCCCCG